MRACLALLSRAAVTDLRLHGNHGRLRLLGLCSLNGSADGIKVISVLNNEGLEAHSPESCLYIFGKCDVGIAFDADLVAVIENNQLRKTKGACKRHGFVGNTLHHTSVAAEHVGVMVNNRISGLVELCGEMSLCHSHTYGHAHACAERAGRSLNTLGVTVLRMTGGQGSVLTELHHIFFGQAVAEQMKKGI